MRRVYPLVCYTGSTMRAALQPLHQTRHKAPGRVIDEHRALVARVAVERDRDAFKALFDYFGPRVKSLLIRSGADHALADDLVQDVMMTVWRKVELYTPERGSVSTWVFTIARNARIDHLRRASSKPYDDIEELEIATDDNDAEDKTLASQQAERIAEALVELPEDQRDVIRLAFIEDLPQVEIAARLDLPLGTVKSRMRLAYGKLRRNLEDLK